MNDHERDDDFFNVRVPLRDLHRSIAEQIDYERLAREVLRLQEGERVRRTPYVTREEAAEFLGLAEHTIENLLSARTFTRFKAGGRTLLSRDEVESYVVVDRPRRESVRRSIGHTNALMSATAWAAG